MRFVRLSLFGADLPYSSPIGYFFILFHLNKFRMLHWLSIISYMLTYILTNARITKPLREKDLIYGWPKEPLHCFFCTSFYVSFFVVAIFPDYYIVDHNHSTVAFLSDVAIIMFFTNLIYWFFEIPKRMAKLLESADYAIYEKIKEKQ